MSPPSALIVTCEHGGSRLPRPFQEMLSRRFRETHRGWDPGALELARDLARATGAPLFYSSVTRLLVELNRPPGHPAIFHLDLPEPTREALLRRYYFPYWSGIERTVRRALKRGARVLHLSIHSFTPRLRGETREADVSFLFDPARAREARFCQSWRDALQRLVPRLRVRENEPYRGTSPSLVAALRGKLPAARYLGVALEVNQRFPRGNAHRWRALRKAIVASLP